MGVVLGDVGGGGRAKFGVTSTVSFSETGEV